MDKIKKYNRLITFGCSNTYGHGLDDCVTEKGSHGPDPSKNSWPFLLGNMLEIEKVVNLAVPGSSNKQIAKKVIDYRDFTSEDLVIVGWTFIERDCIFLDESKHLNCPYFTLGVSQTCKKNRIWQKTFFNYSDRVVETGMFSSLGAKHLKENAGNYFGFFCCQSSSTYYQSNISSYEPIVDLEFAKILGKYGTVADGFHPNLRSHTEIAKKIKETIYET